MEQDQRKVDDAIQAMKAEVDKAEEEKRKRVAELESAVRLHQVSASLEEIIERYPKTSAAEKAKRMLHQSKAATPISPFSDTNTLDWQPRPARQR